MRHQLLTLACLSCSIPAAETPRIDMIGGAAFTDNWISINIGTTSGEVRGPGTTFEALRLGAGAYSVSGYSSRERKDAGGLLGGGLLVRSWLANDHDVDYAAIEPILVLVGGGYWKPADGLRLDLTAEAGPGLAFARIDSGSGTDSTGFRPTLHAGLHGTVRSRISQQSELGVTVGYEYDHLPDVTFDGPVLALTFMWHPEPAAK